MVRLEYRSAIYRHSQIGEAPYVALRKQAACLGRSSAKFEEVQQCSVHTAAANG